MVVKELYRQQEMDKIHKNLNILTHNQTLHEVKTFTSYADFDDSLLFGLKDV